MGSYTLHKPINYCLLLSTILLSLLFSDVFCWTWRSWNAARPTLRLSNNGPAIYGSHVTFYAQLENGDPKADYLYQFEDDYEPHKHSQEVTAKLNASVRFMYPKESWSFRKDYTMTVKVYQKTFLRPARLIAQGETEFEVSDIISGEVLIYNGPDPAEQQVYVSTNKTVNLTFVLHDPEGFFEDAMIGYLWKVGVSFISFYESIEYNFTKPQMYNVLLTVYATFPNVNSSTSNTTVAPNRRQQYYGNFLKQVQAKQPIDVIDVKGNTWLPHRDVLNLEVNCSGSEPFNYCKRVFLPNETVENITCPDETLFSSCSFPIVHYFPDPGDYSIAIYVKNDVSELQKNIMIHSYDISHKMQLSVVIIPIVCSILAFVIIIAGIAWHIHNRKQYMVEVADFDFTSSEVLIERTFFERLRDTFMMIWWKDGDKRTLINDAKSDDGQDYIDENYVPV